MATITGTNLLNQFLDDRGITGLSALQKQVLAARLDQMIEAGTFSNTQIAVVLGANPTILASVPEGENPLTNLQEAVATAKEEVEAADPEPPTVAAYELDFSASINEGADNTFTVTAVDANGDPIAVTADTTVTLKVIPGSTTAADQGTETTNLNDFGSGAFNLVTKTIPAGQTSVSFTVTGLADAITELTETYSVEVKVGNEVFTKTINLLDGEVGAGKTFMLTIGADTITGTSGNDTIKALSVGADGAAATTLSGFDAIDGGAGVDTLNIYTDATGNNGQLPASATVSNVEIINIYNVTTVFDTDGAGDIDASKFAGATNINQVGLASATMTNLAATTTATFTDVVTAVALDVTAAATAASVNVALDEVADSNLANGNTITLDVAGDALTTVNVTGTIAAGTNTPATQTLTINVEAGVDETTVTLNTAIDAIVTVAENAGSTEVVNAINAAASAGGITFAGDTDVASITTGAGEDDIDLDYAAIAGAKAATVSTGDGDDTLSILVNASGQTGVTVTADAGAGDDVVDIGTVGTVAIDFTAGAGDDEVTLTNGLGSVATTDVIDGGEGTDKVVLDAGAAALVAEDYIILRDVITNFEAIEFNTTDITTADASRMAAYKDIAFDAIDGTLTKVADDQVISSLGASSLTLTANGYDTGAAATIDGDETYAGNLTVNHTGNGTAETFTIAAESVALTVSAESDDGGDIDNSAITLAGDLVSATVTLVAALDDKATASTADDVLETAEVIVDVSGTDLLALESLTVSGNGTATVTNADGAALATVNAAGLDSVDVAGDAVTGLVYVTTNTSVAETVTLGDGLDTISIGAALNTDEGSTYAKMDTITGLNLVEDATIADTVDTALSDDISVFLAGVAVTTFAKATTTASTLDLALVDLAASTTADNVVFAFGGNTYIYVDEGDDLVTDTDVLVKLTGTVDLDLLVDALNN